MSANRPHAATTTEMLLSLLLDELEGQAQVLRDIRDQLVPSSPTVPPAGGPVEVTEPAPARPGVRPESGPAGVGDGVVSVDEPAPPATPKKKTTPPRRRT